MTKRSKLAKLLALFFALALVASACGDGDDATEEVVSDDPTAEGESAEEPAEEEPAEEEVELTQSGSILDAIQDRGDLNCGVSGQATAFSITQADGSQVGFDADYCRVVAAAILGDAEAVNFVPLSASERFTAVQTGQVDLLMRNTTWTQSRDSDVGMDFGPTTYFDGQQLMARASDGFDAGSVVGDVDGAIVCTNAGTTTEKNVADSADAAGIEITLNTFDDWNTAVQNFVDGACDVLTTDGSGLVGIKAEQQPADEEWVIFPATPISKEPLGPTYGQNDSAFADVVNWAVYATLIADEYGIDQGNVDAAKANPVNAEVERLLGGEGELQSVMGLNPDAFYQVIKQVGSYQDLYDRHLVPVGLKREGSANAMWTEGGLMYPPPAR